MATDPQPDQDGAARTVMFDLRTWDDVTAEEVARSHSYPQLRALIAGADPDSAAGRVGSDALALQIDNPDLYTEGDQVAEIAEWMTPTQIGQDRRILRHGPLFDALGHAGEHQRHAAALDNRPRPAEAEAGAYAAAREQELPDEDTSVYQQRHGTEPRDPIAGAQTADHIRADAPTTAQASDAVFGEGTAEAVRAADEEVLGTGYTDPPPTGDPAEQRELRCVITAVDSDAESEPDDPAARAEELTRWAPWDLQRWLDDLVDDPDVSDAQYLNAVTAAHTALVGHPDPDDFDEPGSLAGNHGLDDDPAVGQPHPLDHAAQTSDLSTQDLIDRAVAHLDATSAGATAQDDTTEQDRAEQLNHWNTEANAGHREDASCDEH